MPVLSAQAKMGIGGLEKTDNLATHANSTPILLEGENRLHSFK